MFPPMVVQMMAVGEETGALDTLLDKVATFYEQEVEPHGRRPDLPARAPPDRGPRRRRGLDGHLALPADVRHHQAGRQQQLARSGPARPPGCGRAGPLRGWSGPPSTADYLGALSRSRCIRNRRSARSCTEIAPVHRDCPSRRDRSIGMANSVWVRRKSLGAHTALKGRSLHLDAMSAPRRCNDRVANLLSPPRSA